MGQVDDWLAENAVIRCRFNARITRRACKTYQERNPDVCSGCPEYRGGGARPRIRPPLPKSPVFYEEATMDGIADLFEEKNKPVAKKTTTFKIRIDHRERIAKIMDERGMTFDAVMEAIVAEGLRAYDDVAAKRG